MAPELIGRDAELALLARLATAAAGGEGHLVLLRGEAGVGKTVLARAALAAAGLPSIEAAAAEAGGPPYAPLTAVLRTALRQGRLSREELAPWRCLGALLPELGEPPAEVEDQRLIFEALAAALGAIVCGGPIGFVFDDLHWSDAGTLDALGFLAEVLPRLAVLVIATYRGEGVPRAHPLRRLRTELRRQDRLIEVAVEPLDAAGTSRLLEARLGSRPAPTLARLVHGQTEGIPFFIEEVAVDLAGAGSLLTGPEGLELDAESSLPLPESVRDAVLQQVDRLPAGARAALALASVAGREFEAASLEPDDEAWRAASLAGLLVEAGPGKLAFRHSLIRDAIYESIPWARRRALHRRLAGEMEDAAPARVVAEHWAAAGDAARAVRWLLAAAHESYRACAFRDAAAEVSRALDLWPLEGETEARLEALELMARCSELGGSAASGVRALSEAIELLEGGGDRLRYATAERRLAALLEAQGAWERALAARQLAAQAYSAAGQHAEAAAEYLAGATRLRSAASFRAALELVEAGRREAAAAGRDDLGVRLLALEGNVRARAGAGQAGVALVREALSEALARGDFSGAAEVYQRLADSHEHAGDYRAARATYVEAAAFCSGHGAAATADVCLACLTMVLRQAGDWERALELCQEVIDSPTSNAHAQAVAHGVAGSILLHRGRASRARAELHSSGVIARRIGLAAVEIDSEASLARLAAVQGRTEEALDASRRVLQRWQRTDGERHYSISSLRWIVAFAARAGDLELVRSSTASLVRIAERPNAEAEAAVAAALAEGLLLEGDAASAAARFDRSTALLVELDLPFDRCEVQARAAAAHAHAGDRQGALERYRGAYRAALRLGARPLANSIAEAVAALGERVERRLGRLAAAGLGRGGLSPRELEVARLVAHGLTSREVAARLTVSPRTVEMHVHRILTKLDCRTRVDITRRAAELGLLGAEGT